MSGGPCPIVETLPIALAEVLARGDVWCGDTLASLPEATIPSGHPELDAELPGGGWPRGVAVHSPWAPTRAGPARGPGLQFFDAACCLPA